MHSSIDHGRHTDTHTYTMSCRQTKGDTENMETELQRKIKIDTKRQNTAGMMQIKYYKQKIIHLRRYIHTKSSCVDFGAEISNSLSALLGIETCNGTICTIMKLLCF